MTAEEKTYWTAWKKDIEEDTENNAHTEARESIAWLLTREVQKRQEATKEKQANIFRILLQTYRAIMQERDRMQGIPKDTEALRHALDEVMEKAATEQFPEIAAILFEAL